MSTQMIVLPNSRQARRGAIWPTNGPYIIANVLPAPPAAATTTTATAAETTTNTKNNTSVIASYCFLVASQLAYLVGTMFSAIAYFSTSFIKALSHVSSVPEAQVRAWLVVGFFGSTGIVAYVNGLWQVSTRGGTEIGHQAGNLAVHIVQNTMTAENLGINAAGHRLATINCYLTGASCADSNLNMIDEILHTRLPAVPFWMAITGTDHTTNVGAALEYVSKEVGQLFAELSVAGAQAGWKDIRAMEQLAHFAKIGADEAEMADTQSALLSMVAVGKRMVAKVNTISTDAYGTLHNFAVSTKGFLTRNKAADELRQNELREAILMFERVEDQAGYLIKLIEDVEEIGIELNRDYYTNAKVLRAIGDRYDAMRRSMPRWLIACSDAITTLKSIFGDGSHLDATNMRNNVTKSQEALKHMDSLYLQLSEKKEAIIELKTNMARMSRDMPKDVSAIREATSIAQLRSHMLRYNSNLHRWYHEAMTQREETKNNANEKKNNKNIKFENMLDKLSSA